MLADDARVSPAWRLLAPIGSCANAAVPPPRLPSSSSSPREKETCPKAEKITHHDDEEFNGDEQDEDVMSFQLSSGSVLRTRKHYLRDIGAFFDALLDSGMLETRTRVIQIHEVSEECMRAFLAWTRTRSDETLRDADASELWRFANMYAVDKLLEAIVRCLTHRNIATAAQYAHDNQDHELLRTCLQKAAREQCLGDIAPHDLVGISAYVVKQFVHAYMPTNKDGESYHSAMSMTETMSCWGGAQAHSRPRDHGRTPPGQVAQFDCAEVSQRQQAAVHVCKFMSAWWCANREESWATYSQAFRLASMVSYTDMPSVFMREELPHMLLWNDTIIESELVERTRGGRGWGVHTELVKEAQFSNDACFQSARHVATFANGTFVLADAESARVLVYGRDGTLERVLGSQGSLPGQFQYPWGVCVSKNGEVVVADYSLDRIQVCVCVCVFVFSCVCVCVCGCVFWMCVCVCFGCVCVCFGCVCVCFGGNGELVVAHHSLE
jgi:hypothetical protein